MNTPLPAGNGLWFLNSHVTLADAPAGMAVSDHHMPYGDAPPTHVHHDEEEIFHITSGRVRFRIGDREVVAQTGDTLVALRGVPHAFRVESPEGARMLVINNGDGFGGLLREFSRPASDLGLPEHREVTPQMAEQLAAACLRNGIELVGPPMAG